LKILAKQLSHLFLKDQGTTFEKEKIITTRIESYSNQICDQPLLTVILIAIKAPASSTFKEELIPKLNEYAPKNAASEFLKIAPQDEISGLPNEAPSQLHLTQFRIGGCHITSLILGALPYFIVTRKI
jgi:hypothetical protein